MRSEISKLLNKYLAASPEIAKLAEDMNSRYVVPKGEPFLVAFLGEQGIGKSTIINMLLGRPLVSSSSSSSACTSFTTYNVHESTAKDTNTLSDVSIEKLTAEELAGCICEQIARLAALHPHIVAVHILQKRSTTTKLVSKVHQTLQYPRTKGERILLRRRKMARTPLEISSRSSLTPSTTRKQKHNLNEFLHSTDITNGNDIRNGEFFAHCVGEVDSCLERFKAELRTHGKTLHDVPDKDL
jgi:hypothetical protein